MDLFFIVAQVALFVMSVVPIYYGSVRARKTRKAKEVMDTSEVLWYPILMSITLFGFYMLFKFINPDILNDVLGIYFLLIGFYTISQTAIPLIKLPFSKTVAEKVMFSIILSPEFSKVLKMISFGYLDFKDPKKDAQEPIRKDILFFDFFGYVIGIGISFAYYFTKHWILSNIYGLSFVIVFIEFGDLGSFKNGAILLCLLFFYDIFFVFGTDIMVSVAKAFKFPVKLLVPKSIDEETLQFNFTMIGLGDLVLPGIFISLMLEFDHYLAKKNGSPLKKKYFITCFISYIVGWVSAMVAVHVYKVGQPALLYLVPCVLISVSVLSLFDGNFKELMKFESEEEKKKKAKKKEELRKKKEEELKKKEKEDSEEGKKSE